MTGPVQTSAVYILRHEQHSPVHVPPLSPLSPVTPSNASDLCTPIEELSLDDDIAVPSPVPPSLPETPHTPRTSEFSDRSAPELLDDRLTNAIHVLNTEATSLASLTHLYCHDPAARAAFNSAVEVITSRQRATSRGKLVIIGVGKSGHIARKLVATFNSLSIQASFLHPTEALHGDLGHIGADDTLILITFSGKTPELSLLMPHIDARLPLVVLTGNTLDAPVVLEREKQGSGTTVLLPAPVHESEAVSFGVSAPTTSTTMALAVGDALALTCARELNPGVGGMATTFRGNHPGGAIGAANRRPQTVRDIMIPLADIACVPPSQVQLGGDVLRAAYVCRTGWLRIGEDAVISPSRIRKMGSAELVTSVAQMPWLAVPRCAFISLDAGTPLKDAREWLNVTIQKWRDMIEDEDACSPDSIVAVLDRGDIVGMMEVSAVLESSA